jgi:hypothetical protein
MFHLPERCGRQRRFSGTRLLKHIVVVVVVIVIGIDLGLFTDMAAP